MKKIFIISLLLVPSLALAQSNFDNIGELIATIIELLIGLGGVAALIGLIIGGYKYIAAGGNPEAAESAKQSITFSIVGLVVILLSVLFINFLLNQLGVDASVFLG